MYKRGISLTALVVTVIVMILLAGISMTALFGDNGVIKQAMRSKENTEFAAAREMVELAWSARMNKFLEEVNLPITPDYLAQLKVDLNENLGNAGKIVGDIEYDENSDTFKIMYQNNKGSNFVIEISRSGEASVLGKIDQDVTEENANSIIDDYKPKVPTDRVSLYGQGVYTGVSSVVGASGKRIILSTDVHKAGAEPTNEEKTYQITYYENEEQKIREIKVVYSEDLEVQGDSSTYNWKVFYIDSDYVYLIYRDYYPNKALINLNSDMIYDSNNDSDYEIFVTQGTSDASLESNPRRDILLDYLNNSSNWTNIVDEFTASGKPFEGYGSSITAYGGPTLQMWVDSINERYNDHLGYANLTKNQTFLYKRFTSSGNYIEENKVASATGVILTMNKYDNPIYYSEILPQILDTSESDNMTERACYLEGATLEESPFGQTNDTSEYSVTMTQFGPYVDNLYYPRRASVRKYHNLGFQSAYVFGYWLRTPVALGTGDSIGNEEVYACWCPGGVGTPNYYSAIQSTRPLVRIPRNVYEDVMGISIIN